MYMGEPRVLRGVSVCLNAHAPLGREELEFLVAHLDAQIVTAHLRASSTHVCGLCVRGSNLEYRQVTCVDSWR